jgi:hypothetical protein
MSKLKYAVSAALAVGGLMAAAMNAQAGTIAIDAPSSGNSELVVWFTDLATNVTYSRVLTNKVTSLFTYDGAGNPAAVTQYNGDANFSVGLGADGTLTGFLSAAASASQTVVWGITSGAQVAASGPGSTVLIASAPVGTSTVIGLSKSILPSYLAGFGSDVTVLQSKTANGFNATNDGVIGEPSSSSGTNTTYYGAGINQGQALTASEGLYAVTNPKGTISTSVGVAYDLGTLALSGTGANLLLSFTGNGTSAVPVPAAVWLLGSGLLGLAGIGRRRAVRAA